MCIENVMEFSLLIAVCLAGCAMVAASDASAGETDGHSEVYLWADKTDESKNIRQEHSQERYSQIMAPSYRVFLPEGKTGKDPVAAVLVCPGGGYSIIAYEHEGVALAQWFNERGIAAFVLRYTIPDNRSQALSDAQRAMGLIRSKAAEYNIDPNKLGVMGFSAGGHLVASLAGCENKRNYESVDDADKQPCLPNFVMPIYPAYLVGNPPAVTVSVNEQVPPVFLVQTMDDGIDVRCSLFYAAALKEYKVPVTLHVFPTGGHGYGLCAIKGKPTESWPTLLEIWLKSINVMPKDE